MQHPVPYDPVANIFDTNAANRSKSDKGLKAGFDSHYISISKSKHYHAVDSLDYDFDELVLKEAAQVLPIAVVYFWYVVQPIPCREWDYGFILCYIFENVSDKTPTLQELES